MKTKTYLAVLLALNLAAAFSAHAYNHKWLGAASDAWKNGQNWTNNFPNPGENRAMRLFFTFNDGTETTRQDVEGLVVDYLEVRGAYTIAGGPGQKLGFRNTNADPTETTIYCSELLTFEDDLEIHLDDRVNVWTAFDSQPNVVTLRFNGRLTGTGELYLTGAGQVEFAGSQANTYLGPIYHRGGTLRLNKTGAVAVRSGLIVGSDFGNTRDDKVLFLQNNQFADGSPLTVNRTGWLDLDGHSQTVPGFTIAGGRISTGNGVLSLAGNVIANVGSSNSLVEGRIALGFVPRTFTVGGQLTNAGLRVTARLTGDSAATLIKNGPGTLSLAGTNSYHGVTVINDGTLLATGPSPLGSAIGGTIVNDGATLHLELTDLGDEPLTLSGQGDDNLGAVFVYGGPAGDGPVTLAADARITVWPGHLLTLNGVVSGPGGPEFLSGRVALDGASPNTYAGETRVLSTTLELRKHITLIGGSIGLIAVPGPLSIGGGIATARLFFNNQIADTAPVTISGDGKLDLNGQTDTIGSLAGAGTVLLGDGELVIGGNANSTTSAAMISGAGGRLRKIGPATLTLAGTNTHTGATTVEGGALVVNGPQAASAVIVKTNAMLAGFGAVGTITSQGGIVSPGVGPGRLNSKGISFNNASVLRVELNGQFAGVSYDQLNVAGAVHLGGSALDIAMGFAGAQGNQYTILANDGADAVIGTFAGKPQGATFPASGAQFQINYQGGDGNDVVLTQLTASTQEFSPALAIEKSAPGQVRLLWTTNAIGFQLEAASAFSASWSPVSGAPAVMVDRYAVDVPATTNATFFRLTKP